MPLSLDYRFFDTLPDVRQLRTGAFAWGSTGNVRCGAFFIRDVHRRVRVAEPIDPTDEACYAASLTTE